jgi:hypothetical protein
MSLMNREPSVAQAEASRANGRQSRGPRTARGRAIARRNLWKARAFSEVAAPSLAVLGESGEDFEQRHQALAAAMEPRDGWEAAWVQDLASLRWRLERLQRAEAAVTALRRRQLDYERRRAVFPPTGAGALKMNTSISFVGFAGTDDSAEKFRQVLDILRALREIVAGKQFQQDAAPYFSLLYGEAPGPDAALLQSHFESVAEKYRQGHPEGAAKQRKSLLAELDREIGNWEQLRALHAAEHLSADQVQHDAELLLPSQELDEIIRYETHLEDQIERKLRQFYARRRESAAYPDMELPESQDDASAAAEEAPPVEVEETAPAAGEVTPEPLGEAASSPDALPPTPAGDLLHQSSVAGAGV